MPMKLSEAILLGRTLVIPAAGYLLDSNADGNLYGCAMGMACAANAVFIGDDEQESLEPIWRAWPWTKTEVWQLGPAASAPICKLLHSNTDVAGAIAHMFDDHIIGRFSGNWWCIGDDPWTLEKLADWVHSIEPAEDQVSTEPDGETESKDFTLSTVSRTS